MPVDEGKTESPKKLSKKKGRTKQKAKAKTGIYNKSQTTTPVKNSPNCWYFFYCMKQVIDYSV